MINKRELENSKRVKNPGFYTPMDIAPGEFPTKEVELTEVEDIMIRLIREGDSILVPRRQYEGLIRISKQYQAQIKKKLKRQHD